jgi:hypothetical protein
MIVGGGCDVVSPAQTTLHFDVHEYPHLSMVSKMDEK